MHLSLTFPLDFLGKECVEAIAIMHASMLLFGCINDHRLLHHTTDSLSLTRSAIQRINMISTVIIVERESTSLQATVLLHVTPVYFTCCNHRTHSHTQSLLLEEQAKRVQGRERESDFAPYFFSLIHPINMSCSTQDKNRANSRSGSLFAACVYRHKHGCCCWEQ